MEGVLLFLFAYEITHNFENHAVSVIQIWKMLIPSYFLNKVVKEVVI